MATHTSRYGLSKPENTDEMQSFMSDYADNMDKIDENLGGGGSGGGGNVYGAFLDPSRVIYSAFTFDSSTHSWTATEDCILTDNMTPPDNTTAYFIRIDGKQVFAGYSTVEDPFVYVKKGQVVEYRAKSGSTMKAYGITQGTNGIYAPVIYSDNERVIGIWRDNKPLYQRTFVYTPSATISTTTVITTLSSDIEVKDIKGVAVNTQNNRVLSLGYSGNNFGTNFGTSASNDLQIEIYSDSWGTNYTFFATVQYTKTTDVAGSGNWNTDGVPTHHYSTNEQIVGTWIDGKPLYERTWELTIPNSSGIYTYNEVVANLDIVTHTEYSIYGTGERGDVPWYPQATILFSEQSAIGIEFYFASTNYAGRKIYYTSRYTKTTD